jgi:hypothetical protein
MKPQAFTHYRSMDDCGNGLSFEMEGDVTRGVADCGESDRFFRECGNHSSTPTSSLKNKVIL